ncbi:MAG: protein arginine kinase [Thermoleophilia bacterium]
MSILISGVELSRNDAVLPFPHAASDGQRGEVLERVRDILEKSGDPGDWELTPMEALSSGVLRYLVERGLMTPAFVKDEGSARAFGLYRGGVASLQINGRDHVQLLTSKVGAIPSELWPTLDELDDELANSMTYAFDERWGYLTARAEEAGTGLRAHVVIHLPALMVTGQLGSVAVKMLSEGITLSPVWNGAGGLFQVSNKGGLGTTERSIAEEVYAASRRLVEQEKVMRTRLLEENRLQVSDYVGRSLGVAQQARSVSSEEALGLISAVLGGVEMGVIELDNFDSAAAFALMRGLQPGHLAVDYLNEPDAEPDDPRLDEMRARLLRQTFESARFVDRSS